MLSGFMRLLKMTFIGLNLVLLIFIGLSFAASFQRHKSDSDERIVAGWKTEEHEKPYMVLIRYKVHRNSRLSSVTCGGNVITEDWVLTAGHCVEAGGTDYKLHMGMNTWCIGGSKNIHFSDGHEERSVAKFVVHPDFKNYKADDIALLKMDRPVTFRKNIQAVRLPSYFPNAGRHFTVAGWGMTSESSSTEQCDLMEVIVRLFTEDECKPYLKGEPTHFCAGYNKGERDSCVGDSGGGLVGRSGGIYILHGLVSYGYGCARKDSPGYYTKVINYVQWINETIKAS